MQEEEQEEEEEAEEEEEIDEDEMVEIEDEYVSWLKSCFVCNRLSCVWNVLREPQFAIWAAARMCRHSWLASSLFRLYVTLTRPAILRLFWDSSSYSRPQDEVLVEEDAEIIELSEDLEEVEEEEVYDEEVIKEATQGDSSGKDTTSGNLEEEAKAEEKEAEAEEAVTEANEEAEREYDVSLKTCVCVFVVDGWLNRNRIATRWVISLGRRFVFVDFIDAWFGSTPKWFKYAFMLSFTMPLIRLLAARQLVNTYPKKSEENDYDVEVAEYVEEEEAEVESYWDEETGYTFDDDIYDSAYWDYDWSTVWGEYG